MTGGRGLPADPAGLVAHALLLGERLDHRGLARPGAEQVDPVPIVVDGAAAAFAFRWGAVVLMGISAADEAAALARLMPRVTNPLKVPHEETARLVGGAEQDGIDPDGVIRLRDLDSARLALVASALAKSTALAQQEATLDVTLDGMEPAIEGLRARGRLAVSSRSLMRSIGSALSARSRSTARVDPDDKPELLWDHPELGRLHERLSDEFELRERSAALDRKLSLIGETVQTLLSLIETRRALGLEIAVIVLIGIEVVVTLYDLVAK